MKKSTVYLVVIIFISLAACNDEDVIPENTYYGYTSGTMKTGSKIFNYKYTNAREGSAFFTGLASGDIYTIKIFQDSITRYQYQFNLLFEFNPNSTSIQSASLFMNILDNSQNEITIGKIQPGLSGFYQLNAPIELKITNFNNNNDELSKRFKYYAEVPKEWNSLEEKIILNGTLQTKYLKR